MVNIEKLPYSISVVLFTRYPDPGKVKTRLAWDIGDRAAAEIHRTFMSKMLTILLCEMKGVNIIVNYTGINSETEMIEGFDPALAGDIYQGIKSGILSFVQQPSTAFGQRIDAIAKQLGKTIIIGSDIPGITSTILSEAIDCVNQEKAAIALTEDDGYYLIALPYYSDVFTTINYSLGNVGQQTYSLMQKNYNNASIFKHTLVDVDEISDLKSLGLRNLIETNQPNISVIIPTLNEGDSIYDTLACIVKQAKVSNKLEILVIDGGSNDETLQQVEGFKKHYSHVCIQSLTVSSLGRAFQMNLGLRHSSGKYVIFCHADTLLPSVWDEKVISVLANEKVKLAYFDLQFNADHLGLKWVAWTVNYIRRSPYGDQVFCVRRDEFKEIGGFDYLSLLEDVTLFDKRISYKQCKRIPYAIVTNARKYSNKKGEYSYLSIFKNVAKNWVIMIGKSWLNLPACQLRRIHYGSWNKYELLEVTFQNKRYTFKNLLSKKSLHKLLSEKAVYSEKSLNQLISQIIKDCQGNDIFIDVGAKVGVVSCLLSMVLAKHRIKTDIIAFEPIPYRYQLFQDNYSLYIGEMRNKIYIENLALGDKKERYNFTLKDKLGSFIDEKEDNDTIEVKRTPLDDYNFPNDKKISIINMNLEEDELKILKGMVKTIKTHQPVLIFQNSNPLISRFLSYQNDNKSRLKFLNNLNYKLEKLSHFYYIAYPIKPRG